MNINFIPSVCKGEKPDFKGSVVIKVPNFMERHNYIAQAGFKLEGQEIEKSLDQMSALVKMVEFSKPHYAKVDIEHIESGKKFASFDEMIEDPLCDPILMEVAGQVMNGFRLGKQ